MKLGMTFEGGASRTVFSCGVADAFLEEDLMPMHLFLYIYLQQLLNLPLKYL